jgi:hypothetical protein
MSNTIIFEWRRGRIRLRQILLSVITLIEAALVLAGLYQWRALRIMEPQYQARPVPVVAKLAELRDALVFIKDGRSLNCKLHEILSTKSRRRT